MKHALLIVAALALAACQDTPMMEKIAPPSYAKLGAFKFDVAEIETVEEYQSSGKAPHVEERFPTPPAKAIKIWVKDRLQSKGFDRKLEVTIKDASVIETKLPVTEGWRGWLSKEQAARYDAKLVVELKIYGSKRLMSEAEIHVEASRSRTLVEDASVAERNQLFSTITTELMDAMNKELEKNINSYFTAYLR